MMVFAGWSFLFLVTGVFAAAMFCVIYGKNVPRLFQVTRITLGVFWIVSLAVLGIRFTRGIGAIAAMNDSTPWGVWIGLLQSGVALAAGGFVIAGTVHIFHIRKFESILRPMVLTAFLGYLFVAMMLFIEVGRPHRLWHPLVMWQHTSIMFEVAWCVTLYITVLFIEFSPVIFEALQMPKVVHFLHVAAIPIVIAGVILSTLHQSSMGSMFLVMPQKINPLWFSPLLPVFFLVSAVSVGLCMAILESFFSYRIYGRGLDLGRLQILAQAARTVLFVYLGLKVVDLTARGAWSSICQYPWLGLSFGVEIGVCVFLPAVLFSIPKVTSRLRGLVLPSFLVGSGVILNRINVSWFSMIPYNHSTYFPTWAELTVPLFLITVTVTLFGLAVRYLPVFPESDAKAAPLSKRG